VFKFQCHETISIQQTVQAQSVVQLIILRHITWAKNGKAYLHISVSHRTGSLSTPTEIVVTKAIDFSPMWKA